MTYILPMSIPSPARASRMARTMQVTMRTNPLSDRELAIIYYSAREVAFVRARRSVRHGVNHVVHADPDGQVGKLLRILGIVCELPGVADVRVIGDRDHDPSFVVVDAAPVRPYAATGTGLAALVQMLGAGNLETIVQIEDGVKDGIV